MNEMEVQTSSPKNSSDSNFRKPEVPCPISKTNLNETKKKNKVLNVRMNKISLLMNRMRNQIVFLKPPQQAQKIKNKKETRNRKQQHKEIA